ncbi:MAG: DUF4383 domain-containing protein [Bdellovibrionales bacterium]|nr:DUF4383 domain-containing protein [Bdellovibrionales bacterium]
MHIKNFSLLAGLFMLMMGIISFFPPLNVTEGIPALNVNLSYGMFLDMFPMNIFNKVALIAFGIAGVMAYMRTYHSLYYSILFSKTVFWVMGLLAILGLFPETNTLIGNWPLFGFEIIAHGSFALLGGYYGFIATREDNIHQNHQMYKI